MIYWVWGYLIIVYGERETERAKIYINIWIIDKLFQRMRYNCPQNKFILLYQNVFTSVS